METSNYKISKHELDEFYKKVDKFLSEYNDDISAGDKNRQYKPTFLEKMKQRIKFMLDNYEFRQKLALLRKTDPKTFKGDSEDINWEVKCLQNKIARAKKRGYFIDYDYLDHLFDNINIEYFNKYKLGDGNSYEINVDLFVEAIKNNPDALRVYDEPIALMKETQEYRKLKGAHSFNNQNEFQDSYVDDSLGNEPLSIDDWMKMMQQYDVLESEQPSKVPERDSQKTAETDAER